jgi:hypothetical protein
LIPVFIIADQFILTFTNEGEEDWEINQQIITAVKAGKLYLQKFIFVCATHLLKAVF